MARTPLVFARGFTLLEVLVVLVLVGVLVTFAAASLRGPDPAEQLREETERLRALLQLASDEALVRTRTYGLRLTPAGYAFAIYDGAAWKTIDERPLQPRRLPAYTTFAAPPPATAAAADPHILLFADGTFTPFDIEVRNTASGGQLRLTGHFNGELQISNRP